MASHAHVTSAVLMSLPFDMRPPSHHFDPLGDEGLPGERCYRTEARQRSMKDWCYHPVDARVNAISQTF
jgi:hypothetical protein